MSNTTNTFFVHITNVTTIESNVRSTGCDEEVFSTARTTTSLCHICISSKMKR